MISSTKRAAAVWCLLLGGAAACADRPSAVESDTGTLRVALQVSNADPAPGTRVTLRIAAETATRTPLVALQGRLEFDPARLRYVGQPADTSLLVLVNADSAESGHLRLISVRARGLGPGTADLVFDVRAPSAFAGLRYRFEDAATQGLEELTRADVVSTPSAMTAPAVGASIQRMTAADWARLLSPRAGASTASFALAGRAGQGLIYGDVNFDLVVNVLDVLSTSNLSVGLRPLLTDTTKDYVVAANVAPPNLPGLGEPDDPVPPGRNPDGSLVINALDVAAIANAAVGNPTPIAGNPIPGRSAAAARAVVSGTIPTNRTFYRDTIYELHGLVQVAIPDTLTIEAGTRIEGDAATHGTLVVNSGATILARGTRLQPIVMSCNQATKTPGCWGGLVVNGFALLNNSDVPPSGGDVLGCPVKFGPGGTGVYGGCLTEHSAGVLRYVRVEYGGVTPAGGPPIAGLSLLGAGSGTLVDSIQVHGSAGDGVFIAGGSVGVRAVLLTANGGAGLHWDYGWVGRAQFIAVLQDALGGAGIVGSNFAANPLALPRSAPTLYNITLIGPAPGGGPGGGVVLQDGSAGVIRNSIVVRPGAAGLDFRGAAVCGLADGETPAILIESSIFSGGAPDFPADGDCASEAIYAANPARALRTVDPSLLAPFLTTSPDLRPSVASPAASGATAAPLDGFFARPGEFVGAVPPSDAVGTTIPWYAGWTRGWSGGP